MKRCYMQIKCFPVDFHNKRLLFFFIASCWKVFAFQFHGHLDFSLRELWAEQQKVGQRGKPESPKQPGAVGSFGKAEPHIAQSGIRAGRAPAAQAVLTLACKLPAPYKALKPAPHYLHCCCLRLLQHEMKTRHLFHHLLLCCKDMSLRKPLFLICNTLNTPDGPTTI